MTTKADRIFTNHLLMDELDFWDELSVKSIDDDKTKKFYDSIVNNIDQQLEATVEWLASDDAKEYFFEEGNYKEEIFNNLEDDLDELLNEGYLSIDALLEEFYNRGKEKGYEDIKSKIRFTEVDKLALQFAKDHVLGHVNNLSLDVRYNARNELFKGIIAGEGPATIAERLMKVGVKPLEDSTFSPRQRATLIARTESSRIQNTGILQSYVNEGFVKVKLLTAEDDNVCYTCLRYAYKFKDENSVTFKNKIGEKCHLIENIMGLIPFHPLCRCTVLAVTEGRKDPPKNPFVTNLTEDPNSKNYLDYNNKKYNIPGNTYKGRRKFEREYGVFADDLSDEELEFIKLYTKSGNEIINSFLRSDMSNQSKEIYKAKWNILMSKRFVNMEFDEALDLAKSIFLKGKELKEDVVLTRREGKEYMLPNAPDNLYYSESIFSSTIGDNVKANVYGDYVNYIIVPKGTKILYVEGITSTPGDYEVIFSPNSCFYYVGDKGKYCKIWEIQ